MKEKFVIKKCLQCGAIVKVIKDCDCKDGGILCCNEKMQDIKANSTDAAVEKHVPTYEVENGILKVRVNHVMEEEHFIEWICFKTEGKEEYVYLNPKQEATAIFSNIQAGTLYAYCNKHGLWSAKVAE